MVRAGIFALGFLLLPGGAAADIASLERLLALGPEGDITGYRWTFDPGSGHTLGTGSGLDCLRTDLTFGEDHVLRFADPAAVPATCPDSTRTSAEPFRWELFIVETIGATRLRLHDGADQPCEFAVRLDGESLLLTTTCRQLPGQPRQFRYFEQPDEEVDG